MSWGLTGTARVSQCGDVRFSFFLWDGKAVLHSDAERGRGRPPGELAQGPRREATLSPSPRPRTKAGGTPRCKHSGRRARCCPVTLARVHRTPRQPRNHGAALRPAPRDRAPIPSCWQAPAPPRLLGRGGSDRCVCARAGCPAHIPGGRPSPGVWWGGARKAFLTRDIFHV